jgi:hypothetical protein
MWRDRFYNARLLARTFVSVRRVDDRPVLSGNAIGNCDACAHFICVSSSQGRHSERSV